MQTISLIEQAWSLYRARLTPAAIGKEVKKDRATVYRWIKGIKRGGIQRFLRKYRKGDQAKIQERANAFLQFYNTERPHLSLSMMSPKEFLSHLR